MVGALAVLAAAVLGGAIATYWYDPGAPPASRAFTGAATGLVALAGVGLAFGFVLGPTALATWLAAAVVASPTLLLARRHVREAVRRDGEWLAGLIPRTTAQYGRAMLVVDCLAIAAILLWLVVDHVMTVGPDGIATGYINNLGDLPFHLQAAASFGWAANLPPRDPTFAGAAFTYPFLADYLSGMLLAVGATLRQAILLPSLVLGAALVGVLWRFASTLIRDRLAAALTPLLVLLGGGVGWVVLFQDASASSGGLLGTLLAPPHDYTIVGDSVWRWGNAITTLLVPQRSLLLGLPLTIVALTLLWLALEATPTPAARRLRTAQLLVAGLATGALVLGHTHSFIVLLGTSGMLGLLFAEWRDGRWRGWLVYLAATAVLAAPSALLLVSDSSASAASFLGIVLGWDRGDTDPITFWLLNTGLFMPFLILAILAGRVPWGSGRPIVGGRLLRFWLPSLAWFLIPNAVKLAPWIWDNIKVLFYWWVISAPLVAAALAALWRGRWAGSIPMGRLAAGGALVVLLLAGSLDVGRVVSGQTSYGQFDADAVAFADRVREDVPANAVVLAAPTWNAPVFLSGRATLLGYPGWIWAHGIAYADREQDIKAIYAGDPNALSLIRSRGIAYVEVTPLERGALSVNDSFFSSFPLVAGVGGYRLYRVAP
ncbi:MAG: hypothetical protein ACYDAN_03285 [Candidatus Limnocylindrales bacterium]